MTEQPPCRTGQDWDTIWGKEIAHTPGHPIHPQKILKPRIILFLFNILYGHHI